MLRARTECTLLALDAALFHNILSHFQVSAVDCRPWEYAEKFGEYVRRENDDGNLSDITLRCIAESIVDERLKVEWASVSSTNSAEFRGFRGTTSGVRVLRERSLLIPRR